jgi:hypothetical protein
MCVGGRINTHRHAHIDTHTHGCYTVATKHIQHTHSALMCAVCILCVLCVHLSLRPGGDDAQESLSRMTQRGDE